jgi:dihydrofolate synthase/folylpolyglutamate synthase
MIDEKYICQFVENNRDVFNKIQPSFFEMTVAMAFKYFSDKKVDIAVVEVGMGGRLDSTNLLNPDLTIISNIDYDHMQFLGNTLPEIAKEKAGIIKENVPIVIGETHAETEKVFTSVAAACNAPIVFADQHFSLSRVKRIRKKSNPLLTFDIMHHNQIYIQQCVSPLTGMYQEKNFVTLAAAFAILKEKMDLSEKHFKKGIKRCICNTGLKGRWQRLQSKPLCIADIGHNEAGIRMNVNQLKTISFDKLHFVLGVVNDKDIDTMLALLPKEARYYFCKANIPRGFKPNMLKKKAKQYGLHGSCYPSVKEAYKQAKTNADIKDVVFVGGSAFTVAEVI